MPRRDHRKLKKQTPSSECPPDLSKSDTSSALDDVSDAIPDMVESIMTKIEASKEASSRSIDSPKSKQSNLEKDLSSIKKDVESIRFDVVEILRQLPPRERRKPDSLGDVLSNIFSGNMEGEGVTFNRTIGNSSGFRTLPASKWNTTISKIEEASDSDIDDMGDSDYD